MERRKCTCLQVHIAVLALVLASAAAIAGPARQQSSRGAALFKANCSYCHGPDATGNTELGKSLGAANLHSRAIQNLSDSTLKSIIVNGSANMPSFTLSDAEMTVLVSYLREMSGSKNVEEVRYQHPGCMRPWVAHRCWASIHRVCTANNWPWS